MKIKFEYFQNIWNVVFIDGDWWLVQCNWGVRQVLNFFYKWIMGLCLKLSKNLYKLICLVKFEVMFLGELYF